MKNLYEKLIIYRVADNPNNNMSAQNLSVLFGPCIIYDVITYNSHEDPMESYEIPNTCIEFMIEGYEEIFESKNEFKRTLSYQESEYESDYGTQV